MKSRLLFKKQIGYIYTNLNTQFVFLNRKCICIHISIHCIKDNEPLRTSMFMINWPLNKCNRKTTHFLKDRILWKRSFDVQNKHRNNLFIPFSLPLILSNLIQYTSPHSVPCIGGRTTVSNRLRGVWKCFLLAFYLWVRFYVSFACLAYCLRK